jgi:hypothetical protein
MAFPATYNIQYYKGDTYQFVVRPKTSAGDIFPITSGTYTPKFYIASQRGGAPGTGIEGEATISDNSITCTITPTIGSSLNSSITYYYDISIAATGDPDIVYTLLTGTISITADIATPPV